MNALVDKKMENILNELSSLLRSVYGDKLKSVILYGSFARGTQTDESDVDVLVLVDGSQTELKKYDEDLTEVSTDIALKYLKVFSIIDVSYQEYEEWKEASPFYKNISKEGVVLYAA